jgi:hypothetical protein
LAALKSLSNEMKLHKDDLFTVRSAQGAENAELRELFFPPDVERLLKSGGIACHALD